ncbi:Ubiquitin-conjugating enzyme subunit [Homalodisca vitripennis]|nr:Ubiquitin-conjugating enzyme subunit [Homalodisca vitripennis]
MAQQPTGSAVRALALEYKSLQEEPVEGFRVKLANDENLFEWEVAIFGPPETLYQGGYFKLFVPWGGVGGGLGTFKLVPQPPSQCISQRVRGLVRVLSRNKV